MSAFRSVRDVERELNRLRHESIGPGEAATIRTSSMTHMAWVPPKWVDAATGALSGLGERHPARTVLIFPEPEAGRDALLAEADLRCFVAKTLEHQVCSEVIEIRLLGARAEAPASVVQPLLLPDLPVFMRWRGELCETEGQWELIRVPDRLIVDSSEWPDLYSGCSRLRRLVDAVAVSDIAWSRLRPWREAIAGLWPDVAETDEIRVAGPEADASLLWAWLSARLDREIDLVHEPAGEVELVEVDGRPVELSRSDDRDPSDLLSEQLDLFARDPIYEEAVARIVAVAV